MADLKEISQISNTALEQAATPVKELNTVNSGYRIEVNFQGRKLS